MNENRRLCYPVGWFELEMVYLCWLIADHFSFYLHYKFYSIQFLLIENRTTLNAYRQCMSNLFANIMFHKITKLMVTRITNVSLTTDCLYVQFMHIVRDNLLCCNKLFSDVCLNVQYDACWLHYFFYIHFITFNGFVAKIVWS